MTKRLSELKVDDQFTLADPNMGVEAGDGIIFTLESKQSGLHSNDGLYQCCGHDWNTYYLEPGAVVIPYE